MCSPDPTHNPNPVPTPIRSALTLSITLTLSLTLVGQHPQASAPSTWFRAVRYSALVALTRARVPVRARAGVRAKTRVRVLGRGSVTVSATYG